MDVGSVSVPLTTSSSHLPSRAIRSSLQRCPARLVLVRLVGCVGAPLAEERRSAACASFSVSRSSSTLCQEAGAREG